MDLFTPFQAQHAGAADPKATAVRASNPVAPAKTSQRRHPRHRLRSRNPSRIVSAHRYRDTTVPQSRAQCRKRGQRPQRQAEKSARCLAKHRQAQPSNVVATQAFPHRHNGDCSRALQPAAQELRPAVRRWPAARPPCAAAAPASPPARRQMCRLHRKSPNRLPAPQRHPPLSTVVQLLLHGSRRRQSPDLQTLCLPVDGLFGVSRTHLSPSAGRTKRACTPRWACRCPHSTHKRRRRHPRTCQRRRHRAATTVAKTMPQESSVCSGTRTSSTPNLWVSYALRACPPSGLAGPRTVSARLPHNPSPVTPPQLGRFVRPQAVGSSIRPQL